MHDAVEDVINGMQTVSLESVSKTDVMHLIKGIKCLEVGSKTDVLDMIKGMKNVCLDSESQNDVDEIIREIKHLEFGSCIEKDMIKWMKNVTSDGKDVVRAGDINEVICTARKRRRSHDIEFLEEEEEDILSPLRPSKRRRIQNLVIPPLKKPSRSTATVMQKQNRPTYSKIWSHHRRVWGFAEAR